MNIVNNRLILATCVFKESDEDPHSKYHFMNELK